MQWQPIETAPTDECVLMFCRSKKGYEFMEVAEVSVCDGTRYRLQADGHMVTLDATHWMALPDAPG